MIDISDGLAQDLAQICRESQVSAIIDYEAVPVAAETSLVTDEKEKAFALAASGGEDFELLLTAGVEAEAALFEASRACRLPFTRIGEIVAVAESERAPKPWLRRDGRVEPWVARGYDHFA
jgi:thiamine-monophosphate kinase